MPRTFPLNTGFKIFFWVFGIITLPLFLNGLLTIVLAMKAHATVYEDRLEYWWLGRRKELLEIIRSRSAWSEPAAQGAGPHA